MGKDDSRSDSSGGMLDRWATTIKDELAQDAFQRDPEFLKKILPLMDIWARYFDAEVRGFDRIPAKEPVLLVGNHSGGAITPDTAAFISCWYQARGLDDPLIGLAFDAAFSIPKFKDLMRKIGQVPANHRNAARALSDGNSVLVYPGGSHEVFRPWTDRNKVDFNNRKGFIKLAVQNNVRVVPVVGHGGHDTLRVLTRGRSIAEALNYERIRLAEFPILLQFPWGVSTPGLPGIPLPAKITVEVLDPIDWRHLSDADLDDPQVLQDCYDQITGRMQAKLDELAGENPRPIRARVRNLMRQVADRHFSTGR